MKRTPTAIRERLSELQGRCREAGMNLTPQRLAVYRAVLESEEHPTPEILYRRVRRSMPSLSLATIYKALEALVKLGLVQQIAADTDSRRYDANMNRHHHIVCTGCRKITDFYDQALDQLRPTKRIPQFSLSEVSVTILGTCTRCSRARA